MTVSQFIEEFNDMKNMDCVFSDSEIEIQIGTKRVPIWRIIWLVTENGVCENKIVIEGC